MHFTLSLKRRLITELFVLLLIIVLGMAIFFIYSFKQGLRETLSQQQEVLVRTICEELDGKLLEAHSLLIAASKHVSAAAAADGDRAQEMLDARFALHRVFDSHLFLFTPSGHLIAESPYLPNRRGIDLSYRDYLKDTVASGKPCISDPYISTQAHNHPVLMFTTPVFDEAGRLMAILTGSIDLMGENWLGRFVESTIGRSGYLYLSTMSRVMIMHPERARVFKRMEPGLNPLYDRAMAGFEGTDENVTSHGVRTLTSFKRLKARDWVLAANFSLHEAYAPVRELAGTLILATLLGLLLILGLFFFTIRRLLEPLAVLTSHVEELDGKSGADRLLPPRSADEIGRLTRSFNAMVTELDQRLAMAENEKARSQSIIAALGDGICIVDSEFRIMLQNDQHRSVLGDHLGKFCYQAYAMESTICQDCPVVKAFADGGIHRCERMLPGRGGEMAVEVIASPLRDARGTIIAGIEVMRDITERQRLEQEVFKGRQLESLGVLAGGVAHDFNNLLTSILGNINLAQMLTGPEHGADKKLLEAERACMRARSLVLQLLTFARGGAPSKASVATEDLVRESATYAVHGSTVRCEFSFAPDLWNILGDEGQLCQVLHNLVLNARQAMPEGGTIHIHCENRRVDEGEAGALSAGDYVLIEVADQGVGMSAEQMAKIFYPYFTTKEKCSGLGLSTVYSIVSRHGGHIHVESTLGRGSVFQLSLPACVQDAPPAAGRLPAPHGRRLLVMDDEAQIRDITVAMLAELGYEAVAVEDGARAVARYTNEFTAGRPFDAVIIDLNVPGGMGGVEAVSRLIRFDPSLRAIVSSGYIDNPVMLGYRDYGFSGKITKPYTPESLAMVLSELFGHTTEAPKVAQG
ncbi:MAG: hypothetical protein BWK76_01970 [Desulfobulbaceae bacterium A2]|nr:MAG: hypothetical protein BWK76_01970 [Desulfobulbaceae bacterium A2]